MMMSDERLMQILRDAFSDDEGRYDLVPLGEAERAADRIERLTAERDELLADNKGMLEIGGYEYMQQRIKDERDEANRHRNATDLLVKERREITAERDAAVEREGRLREGIKELYEIAKDTDQWADSLRRAYVCLESDCKQLLKENSNGE